MCGPCPSTPMGNNVDEWIEQSKKALEDISYVLDTMQDRLGKIEMESIDHTFDEAPAGYIDEHAIEHFARQAYLMREDWKSINKTLERLE